MQVMMCQASMSKDFFLCILARCSCLKIYFIPLLNHPSLSVYVHVTMYMCVQRCQCPKETVGFPGAGVAGACEPSDKSPEHWTWAFSVKTVYALNYPTFGFSPTRRFYTQVYFLSVVYHQGDFNLLSYVLDVFAKTRKCQASCLLRAFLLSMQCRDAESQPAFTVVYSYRKVTLTLLWSV